MYAECIYVCLLTVYWEAFLPIVFCNKLLKLLKLLSKIACVVAAACKL